MKQKKTSSQVFCGIDEAGRGPVLGPLVMCAVCSGDIAYLESLGIKDSKKLTKKKREELFEKIHKHCFVHTVVFDAKKINSLMDEQVNLNQIEHMMTLELFLQVKKHQPARMFIDCPSTNVIAYTNSLSQFCPCPIVCEHRADDQYVIVGAASIIAKVTRDREIESLQSQVDEQIGSGYPSDPVTKMFLQRNWDKFDFFRVHWKPYEQLAQAKKNTTLGKFFS
ncbi:MAG: ribonuclease HII [Candidatus Woesearchaeota archaeon]